MYRRIKTEEEFKKSLGEMWRVRISAGWNSIMDLFMGKVLESFSYAEIYKWVFPDNCFIEISQEEFDSAINNRKDDWLFQSKVIVKSIDNNCTNYSFRDKENYMYTLNTFTNMTNNCQLASVASLEVLFKANLSNDNIRAAMDYTTKFTQKSLILFDVKEKHYDKVKDIFVLKGKSMPYISSNYSSMVVGIIDLLATAEHDWNNTNLKTSNEDVLNKDVPIVAYSK